MFKKKEPPTESFNEDYRRSLYHAAKYGFCDIIKILYGLGENIRSNKDEVIMTASSYGRTKVLKFLLSKPVWSKDDMPLWRRCFLRAIAQGHQEASVFLLGFIEHTYTFTFPEKELTQPEILLCITTITQYIKGMGDVKEKGELILLIYKLKNLLEEKP